MTAAFRVYAKWFERGATEIADGDSAEDDWNKWQIGFRLDGGAGRHHFTVQGDYQAAEEGFAGVPDVGVQRRQCVRPLGVLGRSRHHAHAGVLRSRRSRAAAARPGIRHRHLRYRFPAERQRRGASPSHLGTGASLQRLPDGQQRPGFRARPPHARAHQRFRPGLDHAQRRIEAHRRHQVRGQQLFGLDRVAGLAPVVGAERQDHVLVRRLARHSRAHAIRHRRAGIRRRPVVRAR